LKCTERPSRISGLYRTAEPLETLGFTEKDSYHTSKLNSLPFLLLYEFKAISSQYYSFWTHKSSEISHRYYTP